MRLAPRNRTGPLCAKAQGKRSLSPRNRRLKNKTQYRSIMTQHNFGSLHQRYCSLTGLQVKLNIFRALSWERWSAHGWSQVDLEDVIAHLRRTQPDRIWFLRMAGFRCLIEDCERFEGYLSEARALARVPKPTPRDRILQASGRPKDDCACNARSAAQIMADNRAFENWNLWRQQAGL